MAHRNAMVCLVEFLRLDFRVGGCQGREVSARKKSFLQVENINERWQLGFPKGRDEGDMVGAQLAFKM